ncbi:MAG: GIY-YIG nuclease family protein [Calditrichaeota bacterium]|nr:MAG: GIY-YIG nuclease family protein [Calditrichota bacterium]MBL1206113.1 GIY-YIG nuclease family protein [Calditrichota bacterium]NOG45938.1 GIY-YIG nuclease family protein [Calditrichota bacterium]
MSYYVYAIYSPALNSIYIGQTGNIKKRFNDHNKGYSKYTSKANDWTLVYSEECTSRANALKREKQLKSAKGREFVWSNVPNK